MGSVWSVSVNRNYCFCVKLDVCAGHLTDIHNKSYCATEKVWDDFWSVSVSMVY